MIAKSINLQITECIEQAFDMGMEKKIIVFPCGDIGIQVLNIMKNIYSVEPAYLIDNHKCKYSDNIYEMSFLSQINTDEYIILLASINYDIYDELKTSVSSFFSEDRIIEFESMLDNNPFPEWKTQIGRYSSGSICYNHPWIRSIGSFCCFADGVDFVTNHEFKYLSTHPMIYEGWNHKGFEYSYELLRGRDGFFPGVEPKKEMVTKQRRATIGNDVWFGRNVIVTNSSNIGNGVIAAAGAVITKDVPDYAVVAGVPARIIRFRYSSEQIEALNKIAWWDWTDNEIRERFDDLYLPIEEFIKKYS